MIRLGSNAGALYKYFPAKLALLLALCSSVQSFLSPFPSQKSKSCRTSTALQSASEWSVGDDWSSMSYENPENTIPDSSKLFNQDLVTNVAREIEAAGTATLTEEDLWINDVVDEIHNSFSTLDPPLYDTGFESYTKTVNHIDDMGKEIAMLVRCNERPEELLVESGRALPPLTNDEKNNPLQLVNISKDGFQSTNFLEQSVSKIFRQHATKDLDGELVLNREGVANWMTQALRTEKHEGKVSTHDKRVVHIISKYSMYGTGRLLEGDLQELYLSTIVGDSVDSSKSQERQLQLRQPFVDAVLRDIRNHGILPPVEAKRKALADEIRDKYGAANAVETQASAVDIEMIMDECEILDWDHRSDHSHESGPSGSDRRQASGSKSSHKILDMAGDSKTPLYVKDGEFVFIDEESCIGCMQCANVSPASFLMLESGRARTFHQRHSPDVDQAVASCPVDCMHSVTFKELKEYESARDDGDGRSDHKHLGHRRGHTPLFVAGIDSDANHRTSWYHTLKGDCGKSGACPQKGCFQCPKYSKPGENPYFLEQLKNSQHIRAEYFTDNGVADVWRKTADL